MLQLKIVKGPMGEGKSFLLPPGRSVTVGRAENCEVRLPSAGISKQHCRLTGLSGAKAEVEDLGSSNGTFVNGLLVKKHQLKPGDTIGLNDFILAVSIEAPRPAQGTPAGVDGAINAEAQAIPTSAAPAAATTLGEKTMKWIEANIWPWADDLSQRFDVRMLVGAFFLLWSMLIILVTVSPFAERANERVQNESVQTARLYARQLVRLNQQAIIDQRYRELTTELDARKGQTVGIINARILDVGKAQIMAPAELIGQSLPNEYAQIAISKDEEFVQYGRDGTAYVSVPIKIGTSEGTNKTMAVAFVTYNPLTAQFTFANLMDQAVTSLLIALVISVLLFLLLYRWIEGSVLTVSARIDEAMKGGTTAIASPVKWPAMNQLTEMASSALAKASGLEGASNTDGDGAWAQTIVGANAAPAAAFNSALTVTAWNEEMEKIIGIRASMAIGADISGASRDVSFEASVRELAGMAGMGWTAGEKKIEFSGRFYRIHMVSGDGAHLVMIHPAEGG